MGQQKKLVSETPRGGAGKHIIHEVLINKRRLCLLGRKLFRTRVNILVGGGRHGIIC